MVTGVITEDSQQWHGGGRRREHVSPLVHAPNKARTRAYVLLMNGILVHRISPVGVAENELEFQSREGCVSTKHAQRALDFSGVVTRAT
jgi:hypothetical protein